MSVSIPSSTLEKFTTFGDLLRFLRRRVGLTQTELAAAVGYGHTQISRLEQNLRLPDIPTIEARFVPALGLEHEQKVVARLLDLAANIRREDAPALGLCPYKGLNYFDEADADLFVGRESLTAKLVERLISLVSKQQSGDERFLAIVGASGSGKSSLVRAGLVPALRWNQASTDWQIHILTPTAHPLESLALSLTAETDSVTAAATLMDDFIRDSRSLQIFVKRKLRLENGSRLLLVVDQFEELFALCRSEEERTAFINNLLAAASVTDDAVILVITLRADFYAHCASYPDLREALAQHQEYIGAMTNEELQRAIEEPAQRGRWEFEPGLVDMLLHDVGQEPGALPLLSHALLETWQRRRGRIMTLSGYASSGGVRGAIAETAETVFTDQFTHEQQSIARRIFLRLTELSDETSTADTRRRAKFNELILKPEEAGTTHDVLKALADARLITTSEDAAEVAHEALIREWPTLRSWLEDNREGLRLHRHLTEAAQEWLEMNREPDLLYRGARLAQAREWASLHASELNELELEFLRASIESIERGLAEREAQRQRELAAARELAETQREAASRLRKRNRVIAMVGAIAVALAVLAGVFGWQSNEQRISARNAQSLAESNFKRAEAQRLALEANRLLSRGATSEQIALLSVRSMNIQYTPEGDTALTAAAALDYPLQAFVHPAWVEDAAFSPDGKYLLTGSRDAFARLWDITTGQEVRKFSGHSNWVNTVNVSPDGKKVVTASADETVRIWDTATGEELVHIPGEKAFSSATFSPDGNYILTAEGKINTASLWDSTTGEKVLEFVGHTDIVTTAAFSPDGKSVLTGSFDHTVRLWDPASGKEIRQFRGHTGWIGTVVFSHDGKHIASAGFDGTARLWDVQSGQELRTFAVEGARIPDVAFSPDGRYIFTASFDDTLRTWDTQTGEELRQTSGIAILRHLAVSSDGRLLMTASGDGVARLWSSTSSPQLPFFDTGSMPVNIAVFSPDGKLIATGGERGVLQLWDAITGQKLHDLIGHTDTINSGVAFSPDGNYLLTGGFDKTVRWWDVRTGAQVGEAIRDLQIVDSLAFSPDGKRFVTSGRDELRVWDSETRQEVMRLAELGVFWHVTYSPDGKYVAAAVGGNAGAALWDASTGQWLRDIGSGLGDMSSVYFSSDSKYILTGGQDGIARLWDVETSLEIRKFVGHSDSIVVATFSPDNQLVVTTSADGTARVWDAQTGQELRRVANPAGFISVVFSPDGKYLLTGSGDGTVRLWDVDYQTTMDYLCSRLLRDFTEEERAQFNIIDNTPTCPSQ